MDFDQLQVQLKQYLKSEGVDILDIQETVQEGQQVIQIAINHPEGVDLDLCVKVTELIEDQVDAFMGEQTQYMLEVVSPGAERPYSSYEELQHDVGAFIHIECIVPPLKGLEIIFEGTLMEADEQKEITLVFFEKGRKRTLKTTYDNLSFVRRAVKLNKGAKKR